MEITDSEREIDALHEKLGLQLEQFQRIREEHKEAMKAALAAAHSAELDRDNAVDKVAGLEHQLRVEKAQTRFIYEMLDHDEQDEWCDCFLCMQAESIPDDEIDLKENDNG